MPRSWRCRPVALLALVFLLFACGPAEPTGADSSADAGSDGCSGLGKSQQLSQPCCLSYGVDACGAYLFCAAFDGRTQPTCYAERSRLDNETCADDRHCMSGSCHPDLDRCRSTPLTQCTPELGCASDGRGNRYACDPRSTPKTCQVVGNGAYGAFCMVKGDCAQGSCIDHECTCVPNCAGRQCGSDGCGANCGTCGGGATCSSAGRCTCGSNQTYCGVCVYTDSDALNCGGCGVKVTLEGADCVEGRPTCPWDRPKQCGSACVNTDSDPQNCGTCGVKVLAQGICDAGTPACPTSLPQTCGMNCAPSGVPCPLPWMFCAGGKLFETWAGLIDTVQDVVSCGCSGNILEYSGPYIKGTAICGQCSYDAVTKVTSCAG